MGLLIMMQIYYFIIYIWKEGREGKEKEWENYYISNSWLLSTNLWPPRYHTHTLSIMESLSLSSSLLPRLHLPPFHPSPPPTSPATSVQLSTGHVRRGLPSYFVVSASASPPKVVVTRERGKNSKLIKALVRTAVAFFYVSLCIYYGDLLFTLTGRDGSFLHSMYLCFFYSWECCMGLNSYDSLMK